MALTEQARPQNRFGTFQGVFRPTFLTILGAMLYLREGWLVGNAGLLGAIAIILAAYTITGTTALSVASVATNVRVRPGGAFAIISQALGLEAGGAIGIPLFIAQALSAAMYLYAFSEAWGYLFPEHDPRIVVTVAFLGVAGLAWRSAQLAFRAQAAMLVLVGLALGSIAAGLFTADLQPPRLVGRFTSASLVDAFAIFFPAATGIMVGVGMSGQLESPRESIPRGTLAAWAATGIVYLLGAVWYSVVATPEELVSNKLVMVDRAGVGVLVLLGLVTSTLMAALSSLVAAPRLLQAMATHRVVPLAGWLGATADGDEPRNAVLLTTLLAGLGLLSGSLDAIAPVITAFFILTFLAVNLVVVLEQRLGMISWRPTFEIPPVVPFVGVIACGLGLFLASPRPLLVAGLALVALIFSVLSRRSLDTPWETVRSGIAVAVADWAARRAALLGRSERAWKPDLMLPVGSAAEARALLPIVEPLVRRNGSVKLVGLGGGLQLREELHRVVEHLREVEIHASATSLDDPDVGRSVGAAIDATRGDLFPPNLLLLDASRHGEETLRAIRDHCREEKVGLAFWLPGPEALATSAGSVDVWLSDRHPDWRLELHVANLDLPVLAGYLLARERGTPLRLCTVLAAPDHEGAARDFLRRLCDMARLPGDTSRRILDGPFLERLGEAPPGDVHVFGLPPTLDREALLRIGSTSRGGCLFLMDSGRESALA